MKTVITATLLLAAATLTAQVTESIDVRIVNVDVTVTSNEGKRTEKVAISKNGKDYLGKREGEGTIYQLDAKAVDDLMKAATDIKEAQPDKNDKGKKK